MAPRFFAKLAAVLLAAALGGCGDEPVDKQCPLEPANLPTVQAAAQVEGPDLEHGCETDNPSFGNTAFACVNADVQTKACCGDVGWAAVCRCGAWHCPQGTLFASECSSHCESASMH